jgi:uncharacterized protein YqjF (DUF2071 family)
MIVQSTVRDCLFLNWALPADCLPALPAPLRYETHRRADGDIAFVSAVVFRQQGLHLAEIRSPRLTHPQCNLRFYVRDEDGVPATWLYTTLGPWWVLPAARLIAGQPFVGAHFRCDRPSESAASGTWSYRVSRGARLEVAVTRTAPRPPAGDEFASWERTIDYFRLRQRGYVRTHLGLQRMETHPAHADVWPLQVEVARDDLLPALLPAAPRPWPDLHSAFLLPEVAAVWELLPPLQATLARHLPAPG